MGNLIVYTDPHLGLNLRSHTTSRSRQELSHAMFSRTKSILGRKSADDATYCAGDFFHSFSNDETTIMRSGDCAIATDVILGGNHDVVNDNEKMSSLHLINEMFKDKVILPKFNEVVVDLRYFGNLSIFSVPHHSGQDLFSSALNKVEKMAKKEDKGKVKILFLHCNFDCEFAVQDTALNLQREAAEHLLKTFDLIITGHDHNHKTFYDGRLVILGGCHPTNFGDADSNKYIMEIDSDTGKYELVKVWDCEEKYFEFHVDNLPDELPLGAEFVKVSGEIKAGALNDYAKWMRGAWKECQTLFALRSDVKVLTDGKKLTVGGKSAVKLKDIIREHLKDDKEMLALFEELSEDDK